MIKICKTLIICPDNVEKDNEKVLDWLSRTTHRAQHNDIIRRRQEGTGVWFLSSHQFIEWLSGPPRTLFCPGIPGAGKSMLASLTIQSLLKDQNREGFVVCFVYCNYERGNEQSADGLLSVLLRQLASGFGVFPPCVTRLHKLCKEERRIPTQEELVKTIAGCANAGDKAFLVIDALDECSEDTRRQLLAVFKRVQKDSPLRCLFTSRPLPEICHYFENDLKLEISAHTDDIEIYTHNRIQKLSIVVQNDQDLSRQIKKGISDAVDGM